jgi:spore coat polysaccharide biosynthesis protein SpsF
VAILLQARTDSTRLPGKALAPIAGRTLVGWCLDRLSAAGIGCVVLATTDRAIDDPLAREASERGLVTFRGPTDDVLRRMRLAAEDARADIVVRATGDNPAVDVEAPARLVHWLVSRGVEYVAERGLPYGAAVEAMTIEALCRADQLATMASDREHVTPMMRRDAERFESLEVEAPRALRRSDLRLTVDTEEDLGRMRRILGACAGKTGVPSLATIIDVADRLTGQVRTVA